MNFFTQRFFSRLRVKFLARSILVLIIGVVGFEAITLYQMSNMIKELTIKDARTTLNDISVKFNAELFQLNQSIATIQTLPALEGYLLNMDYGLENEADQYKQALADFFKQQATRNQEFMLFNVCNTDSDLLFGYSVNNQHQSFDKNCSSVDKNESIVTRYEKIKQNTFLVSTAKIFRKEQFLGVLETYYDLTPYLKKLTHSYTNQTGAIVVLDSKNIPITPIAEKAFASIINSAAISQMDYEKSNQVGKHLIYLQRLEKIDWSIIALLNKETIFAPLYAQINFAILTIICLVIFEIIFLNFFTRSLITRRINKLLSATKSILQGNYSAQLDDDGNDEISRLNQSFNHMSRSLQTQLSQLESEQTELKKSQHLLQNIIDNSSAIVSIKNTQGEFILVNHIFCQHIGKTPADVIGKTDFELFSQKQAKQFSENDRHVIETKQPTNFEENSSDKDGNQHTFLVIKFPLFDGDGKVYAIAGISTDITKRKEEELKLQETIARLTLSNKVIENIDEGIVVTDSEFNIIDANPALTKIFGYSKSEMLGSKPEIFRSGAHDNDFFKRLYERLETRGSWHGEIIEKTKSGETIPQLLTVTSIKDKDGKITNYAGIYSDISELKQTEAKLQKMAHYDALTNLPNRTLLEERTSQAILDAKRNGHKVTMLFIDLDNFKYINDTLGHDVGDKLLIEVAKRFKENLRDTDSLARLGGDEFVVLLSKTTHSEDATIIATKLKAAGSLAFSVDEHELFISTSIGISVYPDDAQNTTELLKSADMAMYAAKESGKNNFHFYSSELNHAAIDRLRIEKDLRKAIRNNELQLYYQPQIATKNNQVVKVEALIRWQKEDLSFVPPDLFIPVAEESGIIVSLGEWIVAKATRDIAELNSQLDTPMALSVNLSARQFRHHGLAETLRKIVANEGVNPKLIEFEITEGLLVEDFKLAEKILTEIKALDFSIALDDFGKGYSSLSYLKHFPIDTLKLDKVFMSDIESDKRNQAIVTAAATLGFALDMTIVCEGIETKQQYDFVSSIGDIFVQGYYCSKALPIEQLKAYTEAVNAGKPIY
ncbi:EAL domain-containing protein [Aliikangiella sp. IMCC44632]